MALINRVSQLFRADFNAVLDRIEEPEQLLKQAVRDMEDELAESERRIKACVHEQEVLAARRKELTASAGELESRLDLCFASGKDDLARSTVRRKLATARILARLDSRLDTNERFLQTERSQLEDNTATLNALRQKVELFVTAHAGDTQSDSLAQLSREIRVGQDEVEIAFLREKSARSAS